MVPAGASTCKLRFRIIPYPPHSPGPTKEKNMTKRRRKTQVQQGKDQQQQKQDYKALIFLILVDKNVLFQYLTYKRYINQW